MSAEATGAVEAPYRRGDEAGWPAAPESDRDAVERLLAQAVDEAREAANAWQWDGPA